MQLVNLFPSNISALYDLFVHNPEVVFMFLDVDKLQRSNREKTDFA